jgi:hypothetical protein
MAECHICNTKYGDFSLILIRKCPHCKRLVCSKCAIKKQDGHYCPRCDKKL